MDMRTLLLTKSTMAAIALSAAETLVVDVHSHFITDGYLELVKKHNAQMDELYPIPEWSPKALHDFMYRLE
ncbi:MAG: hypothetical protein IKP58_07400, partial [Victivallales bacterium]|nr:hypothetical protein [Victivallales bacterium]